MGIIAAAAPAVQITPATIDIYDVANRLCMGQPISPAEMRAARVAVGLPAESEVAPADDDDRAPYSADDQAWWAAHCDHTGWTHPDALTPDEQDAELEYNDRLNAMYEAMYEADMVERGIPCW